MSVENFRGVLLSFARLDNFMCRSVHKFYHYAGCTTATDATYLDDPTLYPELPCRHILPRLGVRFRGITLGTVSLPRLA